MNDEEKLASGETVTLTIPRYIQITGARKITTVMDLADCPPEYIAWTLDYTGGVISQRASAQGCETLREKEGAERVALDKFATFKWRPGAGGGGRSISNAEQALRNVFIRLWVSYGQSKSNAEKKAKSDKVWEDFFLTAVSREKNRTDITADEVQVAIAENREYIEGLIADELAELEAADARTAQLKTGLKIG